eukprot:COSAG04_NODE_973_length_9084_cov_7.608792_9_plen_93_part_00
MSMYDNGGGGGGDKTLADEAQAVEVRGGPAPIISNARALHALAPVLVPVLVLGLGSRLNPLRRATMHARAGARTRARARAPGSGSSTLRRAT